MSRPVVNLRDFRVGRNVVLPPDVVRIDRLTYWGNPYKIGRDGDRGMVLALYEARALGLLTGEPRYFDLLRGKRLACWCAPLPCHGDIIVRLLAEDRFR